MVNVLLWVIGVYVTITPRHGVSTDFCAAWTQLKSWSGSRRLFLLMSNKINYMIWLVMSGLVGRCLVDGGIAAGQAVAHGSSRGAACAGSPGFAWPDWRIDVSPGLFAGCGATSDGRAHRRMAACRSSRISLGIPDTATAPAVPYASGPRKRSDEDTSELQSLMS